MHFFRKKSSFSYLCMALALAGAVSTIPAFAQASAASADDTAKNQHHNLTADQQQNHQPDLKITQKIRQAIVKDKNLSTYAHNVKIITENGQVTLKGPVRSQKEKQKIAALAAQVTGSSDSITNDISIKR